MMPSQVLQAIDFISLYMTNTYEASTSIFFVLLVIIVELLLKVHENLILGACPIIEC